MTNYNLKSGNQLSPSSIRIWRIVQVLLLFVGAGFLFGLIFYPDIGLQVFWNVFITIVPAFLVIAVGLWRNICPMASLSLFPRHIGISKKKKLTDTQSGKLNLIAIVALLVLVPLRHAIFDMNGLATALLIISLGVISIIAGYLYDWKSAWCSSLCPVYPIEKLYGLKSTFSLPNAHCDECHRCVTPCPDTTPEINPLSSKKTTYHKISGFLTVAALPGFIWGWFQVPAYPGTIGMQELFAIYKLPILGLLVSCMLYLVMKRFFQERVLISIFSATAVSCYYWFRLPALFGFGMSPETGTLIDLTAVLPEWSMTLLVISTALFFFWWIVFNKQNKNPWVIRPVYADKVA